MNSLLKKIAKEEKAKNKDWIVYDEVSVSVRYVDMLGISQLFDMFKRRNFTSLLSTTLRESNIYHTIYHDSLLS